MKHPTNKQQRRDIERQKLENFYNHGNHKTYTYIKFLVDPQDCELDLSYKKCYYYVVCNGCSAHCDAHPEDNKFVSWDKPIAARKYTMIKKSASSGLRKDCKKWTNEQVRRRKDQLFQRGQYRKLFDMWYTMW